MDINFWIEVGKGIAVGVLIVGFIGGLVYFGTRHDNDDGWD